MYQYFDPEDDDDDDGGSAGDTDFDDAYLWDQRQQEIEAGGYGDED